MKPLNTILTAKIISLTLKVPDQKWAVALSGRIFISAFRDKEKITCLTKRIVQQYAQHELLPYLPQ